jgi:hypothetical protein
MLGMGRSSDVAGDGASLKRAQGDQDDDIPPEPPPLPLSRALRLPVREQRNIRPHTPEELQAYLKRLWAIHDHPYSTIPLAAEQYMVDRGASLTFVRRIELLERSSIKITPFSVRGAGGSLFARLAGKLELYLEDGKILVIDPVYCIPGLPFNMISEGQLCDLPDYNSVTDRVLTLRPST